MKCTRCGLEVLPVFPDHPHRRKDDKYPLIDALIVGFVGGYGMFFDDESMRFMLCHNCAHQLINTYSWMEEVFKDKHSHREDV